MEKTVKRHVEAAKASVHIETIDEKFFRLLNTDVRYLRKTGGSHSITIPPTLKNKLGLEEGDRVRLLILNSLSDFDDLRSHLMMLSRGEPFLVLVKEVWQK